MNDRPMNYKDYPLEICAQVAMNLVNQGATIHQKWTCAACGSRQTMEEPNTFFRSGKCENCGKISLIDRCNYLVAFSRKGASK